MADSLAKPCKYQHLIIVYNLNLRHVSSEVLNSIIPEAVLPGHREGRGRGIYLKDLVWGYELYQKIDWEKSLTVSCKGIAVELDSLDSFPTRLFQVVVIPGQLNESQDDTWSWLELNLFVLNVYLKTWRVPVHVPRNQMCSRPDQISETGNNQTLMSTVPLVTL